MITTGLHGAGYVVSVAGSGSPGLAFTFPQRREGPFSTLPIRILLVSEKSFNPNWQRLGGWATHITFSPCPQLFEF